MTLTRHLLLALTLGLASVPVLADKPQQGPFAKAEQEIQDAYIVGRLNSAYALNEHLSAFAIDVDARQGMVTLSGQVDTPVAEDLAVEIARGLPLVHDVSSRLKVRPEVAKQTRRGNSDAFAQTVSDASITAKVKTKLLVNTNVSALNINVDTQRDIVTLTGSVASDAERQLAEHIAANTEGVEDVRNRLSLAAG